MPVLGEMIHMGGYHALNAPDALFHQLGVIEPYLFLQGLSLSRGQFNCFRFLTEKP